MVILGISDLHGRIDALAAILDQVDRCDIVALAGDITHFGSPKDVDQIIELCRSHADHVFAVAGNCDSASIDQRLNELGVGLAGRGVVINGVGIHGLSGIPPWRPGMYQFPEDELASYLQVGFQQIAGSSVHLLLTHVPPRQCGVDRVIWGCHVGSRAVQEFLSTAQPDLVLCGHVHEGRGIERQGRTMIVNCGHAASGYYAKIVIPSRDSENQIQVELCRAKTP